MSGPRVLSRSSGTALSQNEAVDLGVIDREPDCPVCGSIVDDYNSSLEIGSPGYRRCRTVCPSCGTPLAWRENLDAVDAETGEPADIEWVSSDGDWAILGYAPGAGTIWWENAIGAVEVLYDTTYGIFLLDDGTIKWGFDDEYPTREDYPPDLADRAEAMLRAVYAEYIHGKSTVSRNRIRKKQRRWRL